MRLLTSLLAVGLCAAVFASNAWAEDFGRGRGRKPGARRGAQGQPPLLALLKKADRDQDGALSRAEIAGLMRFAAQKNRAGPGRGRHAENPRRRAMGTKQRGRLAQHPKARRGMQGRRGVQARAGRQRGQGRPMAAMFKRLDRDGSGQLSPREFAVGMAMMHRHKTRASQGGRRGPHAMRQGQRGGPGARANAGARGARSRRAPQAGHRGARAQGAAVMWRLRQADVNQDGKLTRDEAPGPLKENFGKLDRDEDGVLTMPELRRAIQRLQKGGRAKAKQAKAGPDGDAWSWVKARDKARKRAWKGRAD